MLTTAATDATEAALATAAAYISLAACSKLSIYYGLKPTEAFDAAFATLARAAYTC